MLVNPGSVASTYTGGTTVSAGTLAITGNGAALGTGAVMLSGGRLQLQGIASGSYRDSIHRHRHVADQRADGRCSPSGDEQLECERKRDCRAIANLVNNSGASSGTSLIWARPQYVRNRVPQAGTPNTTLMSGYLDSSNANNRPQVTFNGIPYSQYNAYVYVGSGANNRAQTLLNNQNSTTYHYSTFANTSSVIHR